MAVALLSLFLQHEAIRVPKFLWWFAAWLAWAALGYAVTSYPDDVWTSLIEHGKIFLVALVAVNAVRTMAQVRYFMLFVLAAYVLFPVRSTLVNYVTGNTILGRAIGPFMYGNPNDLAAVSILVLGPALAVWASEARRSLYRWIGSAAAAALIVTVVLTQSRGGFVALAAMALPSGIALARQRSRAVLSVAAILALALYVAPVGFWQRMGGLRKAISLETVGEMDPEGSARQRFALVQTAARMVGDHPVLGVGLGAYSQANADYSPALGARDTHDTYLNIAAETGLPGLLLFLALVTNVLRGTRAARRRAALVSPALHERLRWLQYGLTGYLIAALFGSFARLTFPYISLALLWSASQAASAQEPLETPAESPGEGSVNP
jgi:O-antigen ligase